LPIHIVIPDTQVKPGVPMIHHEWIGAYIAEKYADRDATIIDLGDRWDMSSLSSYDRGKKAMEGRRYEADIEAGNASVRLLDAPLAALNRERRRRHRAEWHPRKIRLRGNHEYRRNRAIEDDARLDGALAPFDDNGWEVHQFLEPVWLDGVLYAHYFANPMTGRPYGGMIETRIKNVGCSFTMGHQQGYKHGVLPVWSAGVDGLGGPALRHGLIAGSCYLHEEEYMGPQGNAYWRGIVVCYGVQDGSYDPKFVSLDSLCRRYEGVPLTTMFPGIGRGGAAFGASSVTENGAECNNENGA
jgi:hypothetical protein